MTPIFYGDRLPAVSPSMFLAGPTTDAHPEGRGMLGPYEISSWRAAFLKGLNHFEGSVIIPEFPLLGEFRAQADVLFGRAKIPAALAGKVKPHSWGVLQWEKEGMATADLVVAWMDCRDQQPGLGLNARPEIQGLIERWAMEAPWPRRLVLGIAPESTGSTRFWALAHEAGLQVASSIEELVQLTMQTLDVPVRPCP